MSNAMFQLKRKSFFRYYLESVEEMIIKRPRKENEECVLQQSTLQKSSASKLPMYSRKKIGNLSFHDTSFLGYEDENENIPKRKENKIMKLLKFKNKRENFQSSVSANSLKVEMKTEVPKEKEKVVESPPVNLNSSHLTETFATQYL
ncbi:hypothetical protein Avbf_10911 [Armadillidium vulgare]|nr:hypothetical protein Avbf_10911 [Armadillidium vulgare]